MTTSQQQSCLKIHYGIVGLIYLIYYVYAIHNIPELLIPPINTDPFSFHVIAEIIHTKGLLLRGLPAYFFTPLYAYINYFVHLIAGDLVAGLRLLIFLQLCLFYVSTIYFTKLTRAVFDRGGSVVMYYLYALYPPLVFYAILPIKDIIVVSCLVLSYYHFIMWLDQKQLWRAVSTGLLLGVAICLRTTILLMLAAVLWEIIDTRMLRRSAPIWLSIAICIAPFTLRNMLIAKEPVMMSAVGGIHFYIGNHERAIGTYITLPHVRSSTFGHYFDAKKQAEQELHTTLSASQVSSYYKKQGLDFLEHNPLKAFQLYVKKLLLLINAEEISNNYNIDFFSATYVPFKILSFPYNFGVVFIAAVLGFAFVPFRYKRLFILSAVLFGISAMMGILSGRYRLPFVLFSMIGAVIFLSEFLRGNLRLTRPMVITALIVLIIVFYPVFEKGSRHFENARRKHHYSMSMMQRYHDQGSKKFMEIYRMKTESYIASYTQNQQVKPDTSEAE